MTNLTNMLGVAIGPQVAAPFVGHHRQLSYNGTVNGTLSTVQLWGLQPVQMTYLIVALMDIGMAVICLTTCAWSSHCSSLVELFARNTEEEDNLHLIPDSSDISAQHSKLAPCSGMGCILLMFTFLFFFMNAGRDVLLTGLLFTYLFEYLNWSVYAGTVLSTAFHLVCCVFAIMVVPVTRWVSPTQLIIFDLVTLFISAVLMSVALAAVVNGDILTTLGVILAGVGDSNIHPTVITLVDETIPVSAPVMALFISAFGLSLVVVGPVSGISLHANVISFSLMQLALTVAGVILFLLYLLILNWMKSSGRYSR